VDAAAVSAAVIVIRFLWVFPSTYAPRLFSRRVREREPAVRWQFPAIVAWTGMRGAVSLAAALAIPLQTDAGDPFPGRDLIVFLTYVVVFVTVVGQGLALPHVIRRLYPDGTGDETDREEDVARAEVARAALERLDELGDDHAASEQTLRRLRELYEFRLRRYEARLDEDSDGGHDEIEEGSLAYQRLRADVIGHERRRLIGLRNERRITDEALRRVEHDLDLDEARLEVSEGVGPHAASPLAVGAED
jgi:monovalent cation/hydrogen antiporter